MNAEHDDVTHGSYGPRRILAACREIMAHDAGIQGSVDFAWQMSWILVLKLVDERQRAAHDHDPIVPTPYRWRDWAVDPDGPKGNELIDFLEGEEVELPGAQRGPGLFVVLRGLQGVAGGDIRDVLAQFFAATKNRMVDGYLLRDVLACVDRIHFASPARARQAADAFEELLEDVRDEWVGDPTLHAPRALVDLVVRVLRPRAHETVLDLACGDGGFLRAAGDATREDPAARSAPAPRRLRVEGSEPDPLAYVLGVTNLLLHGAENPAVYNEDPLAVRLSEGGEERGVDVVLGTLPGGEVEPGVAAAFPRDLRTTDAATLHLLLALRRLRRAGNGSTGRGRAALIVPDHVLSLDGAAAHVRARLLEEANLHTIVRLPPGVFEPASDGPASILFFELGKPTRDIWYYAHPLPEHRRHVKDPRYTRGRRIHFEEFVPLLDWWDRRTENEFAWRVPVDEVLEYDAQGEVVRCDLDRRRVALTPAERAQLAERDEQRERAQLAERDEQRERAQVAPDPRRAIPQLPPLPEHDELPFLEPFGEVPRGEDPFGAPPTEPESAPAPASGFVGPLQFSGPLEELGELEDLSPVPPIAADPKTGEAVSLPWVDDEASHFDFAEHLDGAAVPPRASTPGPDEPLRVTIPPVIDRPDLLGPGRRAASSALYLFTWILWVFVWLPLLTAFAWYLGFLHFRDRVWDEGLASLLSFLRFYGSVVGVATLVLLLWSLYNWWRFGGRQNRRLAGSPLEQDELARDFGIEPALLERIQSSRILWIDVGPSGSIMDTRTRPVHWHHEPASEAWDTPESRELLEKQIERAPDEASPFERELADLDRTLKGPDAGTAGPDAPTRRNS